jgi:hypothetical protein
MGVVHFFLFFLCAWLCVVTVYDAPGLLICIGGIGGWYLCNIGSLSRDLIIVYVLRVYDVCLLHFCGIMSAEGKLSVRPESRA